MMMDTVPDQAATPEQARRARDRDYHDAIAREYDRVIVAPRAAANDLLFAPLLRGLGGARMVDLGSGTGHMLLRAAARFRAVDAVDHSAGMLALAREHCTRAGLAHVRFVQADVDAYVRDCAAGVDLFTAVGFLHHLGEAHTAALLGALAQRLAPGGRIVVAEPIAGCGEPPADIAGWNAASPLARQGYTAEPEEPDEAPLDEAALRGAVAAAGLAVAGESRCWELLSHSAAPGWLERRRIRRLFRAHQGKGVVLALALCHPKGP